MKKEHCQSRGTPSLQKGRPMVPWLTSTCIFSKEPNIAEHRGVSGDTGGDALRKQSQENSLNGSRPHVTSSKLCPREGGAVHLHCQCPSSVNWPPEQTSCGSEIQPSQDILSQDPLDNSWKALPGWLGLSLSTWAVPLANVLCVLPGWQSSARCMKHFTTDLISLAANHRNQNPCLN